MLKTDTYNISTINEKYIKILLFLYSFILLFFCSKLSPLYPINEWSDINIYFTVGKGLFNGMVPYVDTFDHKGPLIFLLYGVGYLFSNTTFAGAYIIESIAWFFMIWYVFKTAKLYLDKGYALIVALAFPVFFLSHTEEGGSAEEFITVCMVISFFYFVNYFKEKTILHNEKHMFIHGILGSIAIFTKFNLLLFWFFPLLAIFIHLLINKEFKNLFRNAIAYLAGLLVIALPVCLYFIYHGALGEAFNVYVLLNQRYARFEAFGPTAIRLCINFYQRLRFETIDYTLMTIGAFYFPFRFNKNKIGAVSLLLTFITMFVISRMSPYYINYYCIPCYVFIIGGCITIGKYLSTYISSKFEWHICLFATVMALTFGFHKNNYFGYNTDVFFRRKLPNTLCRQFGEQINEVKNARLMSGGLDLSAEIFTRYNLLPTFKYAIAPNLGYDLYTELRDEQECCLEQGLPDFFIMHDDTYNYDYFKDLPALNDKYTIIDTYLEKTHKDKLYFLYKRNDLIKDKK